MKVIKGLKDAIKETNQFFKLKKLVKEWKVLRKMSPRDMTREQKIQLDNITGQIREIVHYNNPKLKALIMKHNEKASNQFKK